MGDRIDKQLVSGEQSGHHEIGERVVRLTSAGNGEPAISETVREVGLVSISVGKDIRATICVRKNDEDVWPCARRSRQPSEIALLAPSRAGRSLTRQEQNHHEDADDVCELRNLGPRYDDPASLSPTTIEDEEDACEATECG
jgi:hypothetical protein